MNTFRKHILLFESRVFFGLLRQKYLFHSEQDPSKKLEAVAKEGLIHNAFRES